MTPVGAAVAMVAAVAKRKTLENCIFDDETCSWFSLRLLFFEIDEMEM